MSTLAQRDELIKALLKILRSSASLEKKIPQMLQTIADNVQSDKCLWIDETNVAPDGLVDFVRSSGEPYWAEDGSSLAGKEVLHREEQLVMPSFCFVPVHDETSFQGILYVGFSRRHHFSCEEKELLALAAQLIGQVVQNVALRRRADEVISQLHAYKELNRVATATLKLEDLLESVLRTCIAFLRAKGGAVRLLDRKTGELRLFSRVGSYCLDPIDEKISRQVFFTRAPLSLLPSGGEGLSVSVLSAPLISNRASIGTISIYGTESHPFGFDEKDLQFLLAASHQVSGAIENALIHYDISERARKEENRARQMAKLWELNKALLSTMNLETILHRALTIITHGAGLRFNRAMIFLVNEKEGTLEGVKAVGPETAEGAAKIWSSFSLNEKPNAELFKLPAPSKEYSLLNATVKKITIPLNKNGCYLVRTVLEGRAFNVGIPHCEDGCFLGSEVGCFLGEKLGASPGGYAFATAPLMGRDGAIGAIEVDNLYNGQPISDDDVQFLNMFSHHAGLAIQNATLYRKLEELNKELKQAQQLLAHREKMVALGEMCSTIAHEIRNPLVAVGGFARRLHRLLPEERPEKQYAQTIVVETARLEKILNDIMNYTDGLCVSLQECNLIEVLEDSTSLIPETSENGLRLVKEIPSDLPRIKGDYHLLKQVFINLLTNAQQAVKGKGKIVLRAYPTHLSGKRAVRVEVQDDGPGIDPEVLHQIFNPFYTTRESHLGLGLATVYKIVTSHQGTIEVDNHPGEGVTFIVTLPAWETSSDVCVKPDL